MHKIHNSSVEDDLPEVDERFWRKAVLQREHVGPECHFDKYRWALRLVQMVRRRHHEHIEYAEMMDELAAAWKEHGGPCGLSWEEAQAAVKDSWQHTGTIQAEAIASQAGFKKPPTFREQGNVVPRNTDESNS